MIHIQHNIFFALRNTLIAIGIIFAILTLYGVSANAQDETDDPAQEAVKLFNEGQDAHEKGDLKAAIDLYSKALEKVPTFPEAALQKGSAQLSLGLSKEAEASFRKAVELRSDWTLALSSLASLLISQERYEEARPVIQKAIDLDAQNFPALSAYTEILIRTKAPADDLKALLKKLVDVTAKVNSPADVWSARGALENTLGDPNLAKLSYQRARQLDTKNKAALAGLTEIALAQNDRESAGDFIEQFRVVSKESDQYKVYQARLLASEGKNDEALKLLATVDKKTDAIEMLRKSIQTSQVSDVADLTAQLQKDPKNVDVLSRLCNIQRVSDPTSALEYCRRASELEPRNIDHAVGFGGALLQAKRFDAAAQLMRELVKADPQNLNAHAYLATALFELKRFDEAKPEFQWLAEKQPEKPIPYYFLAIAHDQLQEYTDAMANYQRFLKLADQYGQKLEIDKVNLRLPALQKLIKDKKGKRQ